MATLISDRKLYVTADRSRVVEEGDVDAAFLLVGERGIIEETDVVRLRLNHDGSGHVVLPAVKQPESAPATKTEAPKPPAKAQSTAEPKAVRSPAKPKEEKP